jgi:hypothetical protein
MGTGMHIPTDLLHLPSNQKRPSSTRKKVALLLPLHCTVHLIPSSREKEQKDKVHKEEEQIGESEANEEENKYLPLLRAT